MEHIVLTWVDKRLTIVWTSTVKRIKVPVHVLTLDFLQTSLILSSHLGLSARVKTLSIFMFLQNIKLNFPLCMWHILYKFVQKADSFFISSYQCVATAALNRFVYVVKLNFPAPWFTTCSKYEICCLVCRLIVRYHHHHHICHGVGPLVDPFRSHVSRSFFKGLP